MIVHVGGKRTHGRYLLLRQRVEVCYSLLEGLGSASFITYVKAYLPKFTPFPVGVVL